MLSTMTYRFAWRFATYCAASGYEVVLYESAKLLLDRLPDECSPSCILLDVQMPGLSGRELQTRLMQQGAKLPIVFLAYNGDISVQAIKAGAEDFQSKLMLGAAVPLGPQVYAVI